MSAKKPAIIFIKRDRLDYWNSENQQVLTFLYPPDQVKDLEIVNESAFEISVQAFIERSKISPCRIMVVLSEEVYFEKQLPDNISQFEKDDFVNAFLDLVPFDRVSKRIIKHDGHATIICTNADIWETIGKIFVSQGSIMTSVLPSFVFGVPQLNKTFDPTLAKSIYSKSENFKDANFLEGTGASTGANAAPTPKTTNNHVRELILGFIFLALLSILLVLVIMTKPFSVPQPQIRQVPSVTPEASTSSVSKKVAGIMDEAKVPVFIVASHSNETLANTLLDRLLQNGYKEIKIEFNDSKIPLSSSLNVPETLPLSERDLLISMIKKAHTDIFVSTHTLPEIIISF